mgnify:CR=1 FL=1
MKIFNTLTRQKEDFKPIEPGKIRMYVCGPTVYNYIHLGNARSAIAFDTIRRYFEFKGYQVTYVSNFTDVDDRMIQEARREKITVPQLADRFITAFLKDTAALNIEPASLHPRATHEIDAIIAFIQVLIAKGAAYEADGDVYFRTRSFPNYGQLSGQNIEALENGASEHVDPVEQARKEDPLDFALWKARKRSDEIAWPSPWSLGRPGWHIECSVMSTKYLGDTIDIHGGGEDLEFPHHENEIAQSEAKTGKTFVHYWMHNGFVTVGPEAQKMSKSLHNFVTVHDLLKSVEPQTLRFFMASVQYRRPINYSLNNLKQATIILDRFQQAFQTAQFRLTKDGQSVVSPELKEMIDRTEKQFVSAMDDDFNVQNALSAIYDLLPVMNQHLTEKTVDLAQVKRFCQDLSSWLRVFGVTLKQETTALKENDDHVQKLLAARKKARQEKDWDRSDELREQLERLGVHVQDTPQGMRWTRD